MTWAGLNSLRQRRYQISVKNGIFWYPFHNKGPVLVIVVPGMILPSVSVIFLMKWGCMGHWGRGGCWGCRVSKAWKITREDILSHTGCWIQLYFDVLKTTIFGYNPEISRWIFSTFSVWGCWGQRISLFLKLVD